MSEVPNYCKKQSKRPVQDTVMTGKRSKTNGFPGRTRDRSIQSPRFNVARKPSLGGSPASHPKAYDSHKNMSFTREGDSVTSILYIPNMSLTHPAPNDFDIEFGRK